MAEQLTTNGDVSEPDEVLDDQSWPVRLSDDGVLRVSGSPMHLLMTAHRMHRLTADRILREYQLDHRMWRLMVQLVEHRNRSIQDIASSTGFDRTTMSKIVGRAEKSGFVVRVVDTQDRRRNTVSLTRKGWSILRKCSPRMAALVNSYFADIGEEDYETMIRIVTKLRNNVQIRNAGTEHQIDLY